MKCRLLILLATLTGLLLATNTMAHNPGQVLVYRTPQLSGGITVWDNSYGQSGYAGNINLGFGYAPATYYGHVHAPSCGHQFAYPYVNGYPVGFTNGHGGAHHGNTHGRHHGRGRYKGHR